MTSPLLDKRVGNSLIHSSGVIEQKGMPAFQILDQSVKEKWLKTQETFIMFVVLTSPTHQGS
jgi:hypothetical protein